MWQASTYGWLLVYAAASSSKLSLWCAVQSESCCMQTAFFLLYMLGKHAWTCCKLEASTWKLLHASCYVLYTVHAAKYKLLYASCCMQAAADKLLHASCWMLPKVGRRPCVVSPSDGFTRIQPSQPTNSPHLLTTPMYVHVHNNNNNSQNTANNINDNMIIHPMFKLFNKKKNMLLWSTVKCFCQ